MVVDMSEKNCLQSHNTAINNKTLPKKTFYLCIYVKPASYIYVAWAWLMSVHIKPDTLGNCCKIFISDYFYISASFKQRLVAIWVF